MNIVFWGIIVIILILIWFCLSFTFKGIGSIGLRLFNDAKNEIQEDDKTKEKNENE